jgi:hypothetical protein
LFDSKASARRHLELWSSPADGSVVTFVRLIWSARKKQWPSPLAECTVKQWDSRQVDANECAVNLQLSTNLLANSHYEPTGAAVNVAAITKIMQPQFHNRFSFLSDMACRQNRWLCSRAAFATSKNQHCHCHWYCLQLSWSSQRLRR